MPAPPELLQVAALGLLQGATELLPVSSSAHVAALPWLLGWEVAEWAPERRKELEVALHAGALVALAPALLRALPDLRTLALSLAPPVVAGFAFERAIEERLGGPAGLATGLLGGALAMAMADRGGSGSLRGAAAGERASGPLRGAAAGGRGSGPLRGAAAVKGRAAHGRGVGDGAALALGFAQAAALMPGVSRTGATLAAARALGYSRPEASVLSFGVAGPVLAGATGLKAFRLARRRAPASERRLAAAGAIAAFVGTRLAVRAIGVERRGPLWPWAAERALLAAAILAVRYRRAR